MGQGVPKTSIVDFTSSLKDIIPEATIKTIFDAYDIRPEMDVKDTLAHLWQLVEDSTFTEPRERFASTATAKGTTVYRYVFDEANPFGGSLFGEVANHSLELPYLYGPDAIFDNSKELTKEQNLALDMRQKWNRFAYGERVWTPFDKGVYYAFGPSGQTGEISYEEFKKRRRVERWSLISGLPFMER
ncbi:hypothetical protein F5884DRAFT_745098 [Xylogone sp. PMI_703]|nr:hypothetical protein F5884DRAFT_745098 [Xylogone sp. PMI_703]